MRERAQQTAAVPPLEVTSYKAWCAGRGLRPYGDPENPETMRAAYSQFVDWEEQRGQWAEAHDVDEGDLDMDRSAPFDIDAI